MYQDIGRQRGTAVNSGDLKPLHRANPKVMPWRSITRLIGEDDAVGAAGRVGGDDSVGD